MLNALFQEHTEKLWFRVLCDLPHFLSCFCVHEIKCQFKTCFVVSSSTVASDLFRCSSQDRITANFLNVSIGSRNFKGMRESGASKALAIGTDYWQGRELGNRLITFSNVKRSRIVVLVERPDHHQPTVASVSGLLMLVGRMPGWWWWRLCCVLRRSFGI